MPPERNGIADELVNACAGSGKTHELIERLLALLQSGCAPGEIVAITFTRKAAAEIRQRLLKKLEEKSQSEDWAQDCLRRILLAEKNEDALNVHTFHSWFGLLLAGKSWSPGWYGPAQLVESDSMIRDGAWRAWLQRMDSRDNPSLARVLEYCTPHQVRESFFSFIEQINAWRLYQETQPKEKDDTAKRSEAEGKLRAALQTFVGNTGGGGAAWEKAREAAAEWLDTGDEKPLPYSGFFTSSGVARKQLQKDADKNGYGKLFGDIIEQLPVVQQIHQTVTARQFNRALTGIAVEFWEEYERLKNQRNEMTFNDLEYEAGRLVKEGGDVNAFLYRLNYRFKHILIDEFQDSSPLQWQIIRQWLDAAHGSEDAPSVFIVGDGKQAIYRFRGGDARLLTAAENFLKTRYDAKVRRHDICYRCAPPLLTLVNTVFGKLWDDFRPHQPAPEKKQLPGRVEWHPPPPPNQREQKTASRRPRNPLERPRDEGKSVREQWADSVARRLADIVGKWQIDGQQQPCRAEDILVLMPQSTHVALLATALGRYGLPCSVRGGGSTFLKSLACTDIIALAECLLNTFNDLSLAQALKSPLFALSEETFATVAQSGDPNDFKLSLWERLMHSKLAETADARDKLQRWHKWTQQGILPAHDLLTRIFTDGNILARYRAAVAESSRRRISADLSALLDFSLSHGGGRKPLLGEFVIAARTTAQDKNAPTTIQDSGIRLLTVHSAKGLEAPVVVVADLTFGSRHRGDRSQGADLFINWQPGASAPTDMVFRPRALGGAFAELAAEEETLRESEYDNLLYVALTRAKQALLIFASAAGSSPRTQELTDALETLATPVSAEPGAFFAYGDDMPQAAASAETAASPPLRREPIGSYQEESEAAVRGTALHNLTALLLAGIADTEAMELLALFDKTVLNDAKKLLAVPKLSALLADNSRQIYIESEFMRDDKEYRLDLLSIGKDDIWVIDYKSGAKVERYQEQMEQYKAIVSEVYPQKTVFAAFVTPGGIFHEV